MSKKNDTWMPLYIGDYLADTSRLSTEQHGAYLLLLMDYWRNGPPLDDDEELANITKLPLPQWRKHAAKLRAMFECVDGRLVQRRAEKEREKAGMVSGKRSQAGKGGAEARWGTAGGDGAKTRSERLAEARAKGRHTKAEWDALQWATGYKCVCCGISASELEGGVLTKDHIVPIYRGGSDSIENIQPSCRNCNSRKGDDCQDLRETSSPGWRERLAKRLANARQTPGPSHSHSEHTDTEDFTRHGAGPSEDLTEGHLPTRAGLLCRKLGQAGIANRNPGHAGLQALLEAGATDEEFLGLAQQALGKRDPFGWLLGAVAGQRQDAAQLAKGLHRGPMHAPPRTPTAAEQRVLQACPELAAPHLRPVATPPPFIDNEVPRAPPRILG